ncbi:MAG: hypothetical protein ACYTFG_19890, partial [Planctomycetota bacterium]
MSPRILLLPAGLLLAAFLASCETASPATATAGSGKYVQMAKFKRLFNAKEGLHDLVLVTRDFREDMALWERTTLLAYRGGKYSSLDVVTFDRKHMGKDRVRHVLAGYWPVDLKDDPTDRSLLYAVGTGEFLTVVPEAAKGAVGPLPDPGVVALDLKIQFVEIQRSGEIVVRDPKPGEVGKGIAQLLGLPEEKRLPMYWTQLLQFCLADRFRKANENTKAARAYQRIIDTVGHTR